jgi:hypothetical protein
MAIIGAIQKPEPIIEGGVFRGLRGTATDSRWPNSPITVELLTTETTITISGGDVVNKVAVKAALLAKFGAAVKSRLDQDAVQQTKETQTTNAAANLTLTVTKAELDAAIQSAGG